MRMRTNRWILLLACGLLACGLLAAGCGDDNSTSTTPAATTDSSSSADATSSDSTSADSGGGVDTDAFYSACTDAAAGTPAENTATTVCGQARDALESCASQAEANGDDTAVAAAEDICQQAADKAVESFKAAGG
jgi:hypothetical protein